MNQDIKIRAFLIFCAMRLVPISLGYGAKPSATLNALFGIEVGTANLTHIIRAVMGLYLAMVILWFYGAFNKSMTAPVLVVCAVFMLGLAGGRVLSFVLDGMPHGCSSSMRFLRLCSVLSPSLYSEALAQKPHLNRSLCSKENNEG